MRRRYFFQSLCAFAALTAIAQAQPPKRLSKAAISKAITPPAFFVPSPAEYMVALDKIDKPKWQSLYRPPIPTTYASREQSAFNLGGLIADAYLAIEAQDAQQIKNSERDIVALAKTLGVSEQVLRRANSINDFANSSSWSTLYEELDVISDEIKTSLDNQSDQNLTALIRFGAWVRATDAVATWTAKHYSVADAQLLVQPITVSELNKKYASWMLKKNPSSFLGNLAHPASVIFETLGGDPANREPLSQAQVAALAEQLSLILAQSTKVKP